MDTVATPARSPYEALGGADAVQRLVDRFYTLMDELPEAWDARRIHPESLAGANRSLFEYLSGWFGGPPLYTERHGHPRLRMRHLPYAIGPEQRDAWMLCMRQALDETVADTTLRARLQEVFAQMADHMVNTEGQAGCVQAGVCAADAQELAG
jgi:hemoglobin